MKCEYKKHLILFRMALIYTGDGYRKGFVQETIFSHSIMWLCSFLMRAVIALYFAQQQYSFDRISPKGGNVPCAISLHFAYVSLPSVSTQISVRFCSSRKGLFSSRALRVRSACAPRALSPCELAGPPRLGRLVEAHLYFSDLHTSFGSFLFVVCVEIPAVISSPPLSRFPPDVGVAPPPFRLPPKMWEIVSFFLVLYSCGIFFF